jgi:hypothetical protein
MGFGISLDDVLFGDLGTIGMPMDHSNIQYSLALVLANQKRQNIQLSALMVEIGILTPTDLMTVAFIQNAVSDPAEVLTAVSGIRSRLSDLLMQEKKITSHQLEQAFEMNPDSGKHLGEVLISMGWMKVSDFSVNLSIKRQVEQLSQSQDHLRIGDIMIALNYVSNDQLEDALIKQQSTDKKIGEVLVENGYVQAEELGRALRIQNIH